MRSAKSLVLSKGFTLIELITVIVILGLVASLGSRFVASSLENYHDVQVRQQLTQQSWNVMEQLSRRIRNASHESIEISESGLCMRILREQFCLSDDALWLFDEDQKGEPILMADIDDTEDLGFVYVPKAPSKHSAVWIRLSFKRGSYRVQVNRKVYIKNEVAS